ncbi:hypothetical protein H261_05394 [Paramagnetospirillum caucaseum]|uniref:Uncharacterized protein n=1 Tax=Paramagnetospirillum caucaseum TaxID=1244869 RepID=M3AEL0_9PROT|nr:hypothetical protein [Paramagnetospirillum caucaseum]EME70994.1 hypothetical protein H261_05394 [Paramagnetospirillum caucaseum]
MTTTISWPVRLPLPTFDGYAIEPQDATSRTDMEAGPARQRRRFTGTPTRIPVRWRLSQTDFATFEAWFRLKLADGAEWFAIDLLGGVGVTGHEARFLGQSNAPYKAVPSRGGIWIVTSVLEIRERPMLDEGALEILLAEDVPALFATIDMLHSALHAGLPVTNRW